MVGAVKVLAKVSRGIVWSLALRRLERGWGL